ncbi:MAG: hypothetical protein K2M95_06785 [Clostridiales bacterium]|nr:hypothetical protein [Clostridiales bacterium]
MQSRAPKTQPPLRRRGVYTQPSSENGARLRTIVRRPAARSIEEIEARAEEITGAAPKAANTVKAQSKPAQKETTAKTGAPAKRAPAKRAATKPQTKSPQVGAAKKRATAKTVEPEETGLPLTRKYIILNRRSAASVFNDYLNQKREQEKAEITGSLNTIIIK